MGILLSPPPLPWKDSWSFSSMLGTRRTMASLWVTLLPPSSWRSLAPSRHAGNTDVDLFEQKKKRLQKRPRSHGMEIRKSRMGQGSRSRRSASRHAGESPQFPRRPPLGWLHLQSQTLSTLCPPAVEAPRCALCHAVRLCFVVNRCCMYICWQAGFGEVSGCSRLRGADRERTESG